MKTKRVNEELTLVGHLDELRRRLILSVVSLIVLSFVGFNFSDRIAKDLVSKAPDMEFIFISPSELMLAYIQIGVFCGLVMAAPIVLSQIWLFISPGLEKQHRKYVVVAFFIGGGFFLLGTALAYIFVLPIILQFFAEFQIAEIQAAISFSSYLSFVKSTLLSFGIVFELPVVMFLLARLGLVKVDFFIRVRKYMVLVIFIAAAILTPPDVVSQVLLAIPMLILYEIGIMFSRIGQKRKKK